jgi:malic enzyme
LERYREVLPSFNDDIQGTAATVLAGLLAGARATGTPLREQRIVLVGAGAAGTGIARLLRAALAAAGLAGPDLHRALALVDVDGLVVDTGVEHRRPVAWPRALAESLGLGPGRRPELAEVVNVLRPTALVGAAGVPGLFTEEAVTEMAARVARPLIFPLSNPTDRAEARPQDVLRWTQGRALVATGSPFGQVSYEGRDVRIGQANNVLIFPGVGLGALVAEVRSVGNSLFAAAAEALADSLTPEEVAAGALYPPIARLRTVTGRVAEAVVRRARQEGSSRELTGAAIASAVADARWEPRYPELLVEG